MSIDHTALDETLRTLTSRLLDERTAAGHWEGHLASSALATATGVIALLLVDHAGRSADAGAVDEAAVGDAAVVRAEAADAAGGGEHAKAMGRGLAWLVAHQNSDGGWGDTPQSASNISTTALAWAACSIASEHGFSRSALSAPVDARAASMGVDRSRERAAGDNAGPPTDAVVHGRSCQEATAEAECWLHGAAGGLGPDAVVRGGSCREAIPESERWLRGATESLGSDAVLRGRSCRDAIQEAERWLRAAAGRLDPDALVEAIARRYGKDRTFSTPILTVLAIAGKLGAGAAAWRRVPQLPFELAACPHQWFQWLRLPVVSYALPALIAIGQVRHHRCPTRNPLTRVVRQAARARTLRTLTAIQPSSGGFLEATPLTAFVVMSLVASDQLDHPVVQRGVKFLRASQRTDGSWPIDTNLATWVTTLSIAALANQTETTARARSSGSAARTRTESAGPQSPSRGRPGDPPSEAAHATGLDALGAPDRDTFGTRDHEGLAAPDDDALGATDRDALGAPDRDALGAPDRDALATLDHDALGAADPEASGRQNGDALDALDRDALVRWLLGQQHRVEHPYTHAAPGGWAWSDLPGGVPDGDDSPGALVALSQLATRLTSARPSARTGERDDVCDRVRGAAALGVRWLLDLQNRDGGIPTFCRGWGALPFDRSSPDLTAHTLLAWEAWRRDLPADLAARVATATDRALAFLARVQRADWAWVPLWFGNERAPDQENPTYGTARVLIALAELADRPAAERPALLGTVWLLGAQNADGGWGGAPNVPSSIEETSLAVHALAAMMTSPFGARRMTASVRLSISKLGAREAARLRAGASTTAVGAIGATSAKAAFRESPLVGPPPTRPRSHTPEDAAAGPATDIRLTAIARGVEWLIDATRRGTHTPASPIGLYFAKLWYDERLYPLIFAVGAFGRARQALSVDRPADPARS